MMRLISILVTTIPILFWHGMKNESAQQLMPLLKESGADMYLARFPDRAACMSVLDAAASAGVGVYAAYPELLLSPETEAVHLNSHPAFAGYYVKDEPEVWDISALDTLVRRIQAVDSEHPCYINLYPNWAWGVDKYASHIEKFATEVDVPFYSFDQYPVRMMDDGTISIRPLWYENLEEFAAMASRHGKPFWAFALTTSHHLGAPSPEAFYPVPTAGHLRLQVFSDLAYGAQAVQYFTFAGLYDAATLEKTPVFDIVREVNGQIKNLSDVFSGCKVLGVWHTGLLVPAYTTRYYEGAVRGLGSVSSDTEGLLLSLIENGGNRYLVVVNRDCVNETILNIGFTKPVLLRNADGSYGRFKKGGLEVAAGDIRIFKFINY